MDVFLWMLGVFIYGVERGRFGLRTGLLLGEDWVHELTCRLGGRYYEGGVSSVYFWDLDDGFAGVILLKKSEFTAIFVFRCGVGGYHDSFTSTSALQKHGFESANTRVTASPKGKTEGGWDSIHVFEAIDKARTSHYKLTSTVILHLSTSSENLGDMDLSGNMTRQVEQNLPVENDVSHIVNIGKLVEDMELKMRNLLRMQCLLVAYIYEMLISGRGGVLWEGKGRGGRPSK